MISLKLLLPSLSPFKLHVNTICDCHFLLSYSLADAGGVHLEEGVVHEEVEGLLLPGAPGVLVPAQAAQQLDAGPVAGGVVSTASRNRKW